MKGVAGGELRDGGSFGMNWGFDLWWFPVEFEVLVGSARLRGREWWHWMDERSFTRDELDRRATADELAGDGEEGFPPSLAGRGAH